MSREQSAATTESTKAAKPGELTKPRVNPDVDVAILGAGLAGIGAATRLKTELPTRSIALIDARTSVGGTWDLFRYPGVRSDSDLLTYGYQYKPWLHEKAIAPGDAILSYLQEAVTEYGLESSLRLGCKVIGIDWSSEHALWTISMLHTQTGDADTLTARWIFGATGYFDHAEGYRPIWEGEDTFAGTIVHPQHWPEDLDYSGKAVVVVGSGATAVTLLPAMAEQADHTTMLQRSPSYVVPLPSKDVLLSLLKRFLPAGTAFKAARRVNIQQARWVFELSRRFPRGTRRAIRWINKVNLPKDFDVDTHFNPSYAPWDERMCVVPDGDMFKAIKAGKATVVTDQIKRFTPDGLELQSGRFLPADVVVTATGMNLLALGGIQASIDGKPLSWADTIAFKAMMLSGVPNFAYALGYTSQSWTLKVDLITAHWCRLLRHMEQHHYDAVVPTLDDRDMPVMRLMEDLTSGYMERGIAAFPKQGTSGPWTAPSHYPTDIERLDNGPVEDDALVFTKLPTTVSPPTSAAPTHRGGDEGEKKVGTGRISQEEVLHGAL